jgi:ferredoxin-NADP reductase
MGDQSAPTNISRRPSIHARIVRIFNHNSDTRSIFLETPTMPPVVPGQFVSVAIPLDGETLTRPYTVASSFGDRELELCFNRVPGGRGVAYLFDRKVGDTLELTGPFGLFTLEAAPSIETVFIAEATAIAPLRPMIRRAVETVPLAPLFLLYAASDAEHLLYLNEIQRYAATEPLFSFETVITPEPWRGLAEIARARWIERDAVRKRQFFICGANEGVLTLRDMLRGAGYERRAVRYEKW